MSIATIVHKKRRKKGPLSEAERAARRERRKARMRKLNRDLSRQRPDFPDISDEQMTGSELAGWLFEAASKKFLLFCVPDAETTDEQLLRRFSALSNGFLVNEARDFAQELDRLIRAKRLTISVGKNGRANELALAQSLLGNERLVTLLRTRG